MVVGVLCMFVCGVCVGGCGVGWVVVVVTVVKIATKTNILIKKKAN